jgi:hypothetical protein
MGFGAAMDVFTKIDTDVTKSRCVHVAKASAFVLEPTSAGNAMGPFSQARCTPAFVIIVWPPTHCEWSIC